MKPAPPCYQCEARRPGCHSPEACALWAAYAAEKQTYDAARQSARDDYETTADYVRQKQTRIKRRERFSRNRK